ncbi:MAG: hypothetical protein JWP57_3677 [Spirosoma sp.]|nr:hypothetical protein [Spirosoma sp.]
MKEEFSKLSKSQTQQVCRKLGKLVADCGITHQAIADKTGYLRPSITRLLSGRFPPHLDYLFCILAAVNDLTGHDYSLKDIDVPASEVEGN